MARRCRYWRRSRPQAREGWMWHPPLDAFAARPRIPKHASASCVVRRTALWSRYIGPYRGDTCKCRGSITYNELATQIPVPDIGPEDAFKVAATGMCRSDCQLSTIQQGAPLVGPITPGHEVAGRIAASAPRCHALRDCRRATWSWSRRHRGARSSSSTSNRTHVRLAWSSELVHRSAELDGNGAGAHRQAAPCRVAY